MTFQTQNEPVEILLVEDNPGDVLLTREALAGSKILNPLRVVADGVEALDFLHRRPPHESVATPGLILLDLNLPRKSGREVLEEIKADEHLKTIPVVVLTTSDADADILASYRLHANCYITKPVDLPQFLAVVRGITGFWLSIVKLPPAPP